MTETNRIVACSWQCDSCDQKGSVRVWSWPKEEPKHTTERHQRETRDRCVFGCLYRSKARNGHDGDSGTDPVSVQP